MKSKIKNSETNPYDLNDILKMRLSAGKKRSIELQRSDPYSAVNINYKKITGKDRDKELLR